jgi:DNA mismatch repair ATPase MutS
LNIVEAFCENSEFRDLVHQELLKEVPDIDIITKRIHKMNGKLKVTSFLFKSGYCESLLFYQILGKTL